MNIATVVNSVIGELTDFEIDRITEQTLISDIHLVSLDYVSIQVALKKNSALALTLTSYRLPTLIPLVNSTSSAAKLAFSPVNNTARN